MKLIVDVRVKNLDRAVRFYTETLGLMCRIHESAWAGIVVGGLLAPDGTRQTGAEIHLYIDGGVTDSVEFYVDDIDRKVQELSKKGVTFISGYDKPSALGVNEHGITEFPWGRLAYFKDSEGNELALVQDT